MKTKGILIALTLVIFTSINLSITATAQDGKSDPTNHRINIRVNQDNKVMLRAACLEDQKWVNLVLRVYSDKGEMVYATSIHKKGGIYRAFDMEKLPEGKYSFEVYKNLKKVYTKEVIKSSDIASTLGGSKKMRVQEL